MRVVSLEESGKCSSRKMNPNGSTPAASTIYLHAGVGVLGSATTRSLTQVPDFDNDHELLG